MRGAVGTGSCYDNSATRPNALIADVLRPGDGRDAWSGTESVGICGCMYHRRPVGSLFRVPGICGAVIAEETAEMFDRDAGYCRAGGLVAALALIQRRTDCQGHGPGPMYPRLQ
jgi:hypothetical protein